MSKLIIKASDAKRLVQTSPQDFEIRGERLKLKNSEHYAVFDLFGLEREFRIYDDVIHIKGTFNIKGDTE
jgi:hypothetical protein